MDEEEDTDFLMRIRDLLNLDALPQWEEEIGDVGMEGPDGQFYIAGGLVFSVVDNITGALMRDLEESDQSEEAQSFVAGVMYMSSVIEQTLSSAHSKVMPVFIDSIVGEEDDE